MGAHAKLQPEPLEQLKMSLEDAPRSYGFLSDYVRALEWFHHEEDIFIQHAFGNVNSGGSHAPSGGDSLTARVLSELYESLDAEHKVEIRGWWHQMVRAKANRFTDLKARLSKLT